MVKREHIVPILLYYSVFSSWLRLCLKAHWKPAIPLALDFVTVQGRMKYTRPIYRDLNAWDASRDLAIERFKANRPYMHGTTAAMVAKDLGIN